MRGRQPTEKREIQILKPDEREGMRRAGRFNAELMDFLRTQIREGITTAEIDRLAHDYTVDHGHTPACLGYRGYPNTVCTSVNEVVCHGVPNDYALRPGDIVNVDATTIVDGFFGDSSETFMVPPISDAARRLVQVTFECLFLGIHACKPFGRVIEIGRAIERHARMHRFSVVREYQGHGIGSKFHLDPGIPHYPLTEAAKWTLLPGICFTVEPMINAGNFKTEVDKKDEWTVRTSDRQLSAQFEHTVLMTERGPEILTLTKNGPQPGHKF